MVEFRVPAGFRVDRTSGRTGTSQKGQRPDSCATAKGAYWIVGLAEQRERNCKPEAERLLGLGVLLQRQKLLAGVCANLRIPLNPKQLKIQRAGARALGGAGEYARRRLGRGAFQK